MACNCRDIVVSLVYSFGKVVRSMKQYEVLMAKKLFDGSDVIRAYSYKAVYPGDNYAHFWESDCFVYCSPGKGSAINMAES